MQLHYLEGKKKYLKIDILHQYPMISIIDTTCKEKQSACYLTSLRSWVWEHDCFTHFKSKHAYNKNPLKPLRLISLAPASVVDEGKQASECIKKILYL